MPQLCVRGSECDSGCRLSQVVLVVLIHCLGRELAAFLQQNPKLEIAGDTLEEQDFMKISSRFHQGVGAMGLQLFGGRLCTAPSIFRLGWRNRNGGLRYSF